MILISYKELGIDYRDCGPWRSYELDTQGATREELIENATISETDQDGGELDSYAIEDAPSNVEAAALRAIDRAITERKPAITEVRK